MSRHAKLFVACLLAVTGTAWANEELLHQVLQRRAQAEGWHIHYNLNTTIPVRDIEQMPFPEVAVPLVAELNRGSDRQAIALRCDENKILLVVSAKQAIPPGCRPISETQGVSLAGHS